MKFCFVVEDIYPTLISGEDADGRSVLLINFGKGLVGLGHEVSYITMDYGQDDVKKICGCTVYKMYKPNSGIPGLRFIMNKIPKTIKALKNSSADVYLFMCPDPLAGIIAWYCKRNNKKFVYYGAHDYDFDSNRKKLNIRDFHMFHYSIKHADLVLCQNEFQKKTLGDNYKRKGTILYNPMKSAEHTYNVDGNIVWMAKYYPVKRPEMFIKLSKEVDDSFVMIGGKPPNMTQKQFNQINSKACNNNIEICGKLDYEKADDILSRSKLLVSTAKAEGFSNTFLQAWRRGIPVVSFVDPDDMIKNNKLGKVVNSFEELVETVETLRKGISIEHSKKIKEFFDRTFATEIVVKRFEEIIKNSLK